MSGISLSSLLGSTSSTSSSSTLNYGIDLSEYASIKNGTYRKLAKAYYAQQESEEASETSTDSKQTLTTLKSNANSLKTAASALTSHSLWQKKNVETTDEETGEKTTTYDYDRDAINSAVKSFVEQYNSMIEEAGDSETTGVLRATTRMISQTESVSSLLNEVGITIGSDNKLTIDEDKLNSANVSTLSSLFEGSGSYADQISQKASAISRSASEATDTYTSDGTYTSATSSVSSASTSSSKATYQISSDMQEAIFDQVQLDFYMYGGKATSDSASYTRQLEKYLDSLDEDKQDDAKDSIEKFRDELTNQITKAIKAQDSDWKLGDTVDATILSQVLKQEDDLLEKTAKSVYGNSFSQTV